MKRLSMFSTALVVSVPLVLTGCQQSASAPGGEVVPPLAPSLDKRADHREKTIRIISGQIVFDATTQTQTFDLKGTQGMRLVGTVLEPIVNISPFTGCLPCEPGTPISLAGRLVGLSLSGTATLRDATYRLGSGYYDAGADLHFSGDVVIAPPIADQPVQVSAAVQLSGGEPFEPSVLLIPGLGAQPFTGQGVATLVFQRYPDIPLWQITSVVYAF